MAIERLGDIAHRKAHVGYDYLRRVHVQPALYDKYGRARSDCLRRELMCVNLYAVYVKKQRTGSILRESALSDKT